MVESSDGLLMTDATLDRDVDLEAPVQNLCTEWADHLETEFEHHRFQIRIRLM